MCCMDKRGVYGFVCMLANGHFESLVFTFYPFPRLSHTHISSPSISDVTGLRISTQDKCNPNTCKSIVKKLATAKKKAKTSPSTLTKLVLHGPKIYGTLIAELVKNDVGRGLTSLSFENVKQTQQTKLGGSVVDLFRSCTQLEELYISQQLATAAGTLRSTGKSQRLPMLCSYS